MAESKKKKFVPFKERDVIARRPVLLKSDREISKEVEKEKVVQEIEKQPTILLKPRDPTTTKDAENRSHSPKKVPNKDGEVETQIIQPSKIIQNEEKSKERKVNEMKILVNAPLMQKPLKLLDCDLEFHSSLSDYLQDTSTNFLVVGVIGSQGVGKSTVLNLLSVDSIKENICQSILSSHELDRNLLEKEPDEHSLIPDRDFHKPVEKEFDHSFFKFKMQDIDQIELGHHCTNGVDVYVKRNERIIMLDTGGCSSLPERCAQLDHLQIAAFLMTVCHVVILVQDWFTDYNILRFVQAAEMLRPSLSASGPQPSASNISAGIQEASESATFSEHHPHLLILHNRCTFEDFRSENVKMMQNFYQMAFINSKLQLDSGMYLYSADGKKDFPTYNAFCHSFSMERCGQPINLFLLPEIYDDFDNKEIYRGHPPFEELAERLRWTVFGASRLQLTNIPNLSEKAWLHYCNKSWETIKKSSFFKEYGRLLP